MKSSERKLLLKIARNQEPQNVFDSLKILLSLKIIRTAHSFWTGPNPRGNKKIALPPTIREWH